MAALIDSTLVSLVRRKQFDSAAELLGSDEAQSPAVRLVAARMELMRGDLFSGFEGLAALAAMHPNSAVLHYRAGRAALRCGLWTAAEAAFRRAYGLGMNAKVVAGQLGIALFRQGRMSEARDFLLDWDGDTALCRYYQAFAEACLIQDGTAPETARTVFLNAAHALPRWAEPRAWRIVQFVRTRQWGRVHVEVPVVAKRADAAKWADCHMLACELRMGRTRKPKHVELELAEKLLSAAGRYVEQPDFIFEPYVNARSIIDLVRDCFLADRVPYDAYVAWVEAVCTEEMTGTLKKVLFAEALLFGGHAQDAITLLKECLEEAPDAATQAMLLEGYRKADDFDSLAEMAKQLIASGQIGAAVYEAYAISQLGKGRIEEAEVMLWRAEYSGGASEELKKRFATAAGRMPRNPENLPMHYDFDYAHVGRSAVFAPQFAAGSGCASVLGDFSFLAGLRSTGVVLRALMLRNIQSRSGGSQLGYVWALLQPMLVIGVLYALFASGARRLPEGVTPLSFLVAGIGAFYVFSGTSGATSNILRSNRPLLYFRQISPLMMFMGRLALEFFTSLVVYVILIALIPVVGEPLALADPLRIAFSFTALVLFGGFLGLLVAVGQEYVPSLRYIFGGFRRILFFSSGTFFHAAELPADLRDILLINPLFHCMEILRSGFYAGYDGHYGDVGYVLSWLLGMLFFAVAAERFSRRRTLEPN